MFLPVGCPYTMGDVTMTLRHGGKWYDFLNEAQKDSESETEVWANDHTGSKAKRAAIEALNHGTVQIL